MCCRRGRWQLSPRAPTQRNGTVERQVGRAPEPTGGLGHRVVDVDVDVDVVVVVDVDVIVDGDDDVDLDVSHVDAQIIFVSMATTPSRRRIPCS